MVGFPHEIKGEGVYAYIVLKEIGSKLTNDQKKKLAAELRAVVKQKISGFAVPDQIQVNQLWANQINTWLLFDTITSLNTNTYFGK